MHSACVERQVRALLSPDAVGLAGDGMLPGLALGLRPASAAAARGPARQAVAAGPPPAGLPRPPLRPHLHQQQARLTPVAAPGSKQARAAAAVEPQAGGRLADAGQHAAQPADTGEAAAEERVRSASPMEVAEPSQQVGLSPGAAELPAASALQPSNASPAAAGAEAALPAPAATPMLGDAAGAGALAPARRSMSSPAADWHCLHQAARQLVEEVLKADPAQPGFAAGPYPMSAEQANDRYTRVVSMQPLPFTLGWCHYRHRFSRWCTECLLAHCTMCC